MAFSGRRGQMIHRGPASVNHARERERVRLTLNSRNASTAAPALQHERVEGLRRPHGGEVIRLVSRRTHSSGRLLEARSGGTHRVAGDSRPARWHPATTSPVLTAVRVSSSMPRDGLVQRSPGECSRISAAARPRSASSSRAGSNTAMTASPMNRRSRRGLHQHRLHRSKQGHHLAKGQVGSPRRCRPGDVGKRSRRFPPHQRDTGVRSPAADPPRPRRKCRHPSGVGRSQGCILPQMALCSSGARV
jgi:hypothetical protein